MLVHMTRRYLAQEPPFEEPELASMLGVPLSAQEEIVEDFIDHGLVYRTVDPKGLMLGKPPEQVTVLEILQLVSHREYPPVPIDSHADDPVVALLRAKDQAIQEALNGMTLKMLAAKDPSALALSESSSILVDEPVS